MGRLTRRDFLRRSSRALAWGAIGGLGVACGPDAPDGGRYVAGSPIDNPVGPDSPNVLFVSIDDLNDWASPFGGRPGVHTPHLARLAERGVAFQRAYCAAPACNPSRAAVMTGRAPHVSGVYEWESFRAVGPEVVTLPMRLRRAGYRTLGGGKLFHGTFRYADDGGWNRGFWDPEAWDGYFHFERAPALPRAPLSGMDPPLEPPFDFGAAHDAEEESLPDRRLAAWAADQLAREHAAPLFLGVGFYRPHLPWTVPQRYFDLYPLDAVQLPDVDPDDLDDVPAVGRAWAAEHDDHGRITRQDRWREAVRSYLASISFADACLGQVLDALDAGPLADRTAVVLWSDHGWHLGEKLAWRKFKLWERAARVPLLLALPGAARGASCPRVASLLDLYPTLAELCLGDAPQDLSGRSLVRLAHAPDAARDAPALTTWGRGNHSVRSERWRYIRYADGGEELYDHAADPGERTNLLGPRVRGARREALAARERLLAFVPADAPGA